MKIVYTISATYNSGGMERVLANKANYLVQQGYQVIIITTDQRGRSPYFALDERIECIDLGINYDDNAGKSLPEKLWSYPAKRKQHRGKLSEALLKARADIAVSMFDHDADFLWRTTDGSKKVLEIHFSHFKRLQYGRRGLWKLIDRWRNHSDAVTAARYDRFVVLTQEDRTYWGSLDNICVIPNAASFPLQEQPAPLENKAVIAVGRYDYQKNFEALIGAWGTVHKVMPDWKLYIYGDGLLKSFYQTLIEQFGLQGSVILHPPTRNIQEAYLQSSILAMSSRYEGLPMTLLEAQACGLPMVSFACKCGPRDVISHGSNGLLVEPGDIEGLATSLIQLMSDPEQRKQMGVCALENAKKFTSEAVMKSWMNLFENLCKTKRRS